MYFLHNQGLNQDFRTQGAHDCSKVCLVAIGFLNMNGGGMTPYVLRGYAPDNIAIHPDIHV